MTDDIVHGWKGIACVIGRCEKTAERWHKDGMPVWRGPGGRPFSYKSVLLKYVNEVAKRYNQQPNV